MLASSGYTTSCGGSRTITSWDSLCLLLELSKWTASEAVCTGPPDSPQQTVVVPRVGRRDVPDGEGPPRDGVLLRLVDVLAQGQVISPERPDGDDIVAAEKERIYNLLLTQHQPTSQLGREAQGTCPGPR